ncbi:MAG: DUF72 domain-containing protein [Bryobacteraceae bacterium]|nr:DUF72 domain-containing protein [Bryobacteraceae bacterium]
MLPLFDEEPATGFDRTRLAERLRQLAGEQIYFGTSSWKYEGWLGQIYDRQSYLVRGRFSKKQFEKTCLREYSQTFPIVCGDFSFYQFPTAEFWNGVFASAPPSLLFAFKVPEEVTCKVFPTHPRYGPRAGQPNPSFLDFGVFERLWLEPLQRWRDRIPVLIFEFGTFSRRSYSRPQDFFADLDRFLAKLPTSWRYAVEVRNEDYLQPEYFAVLRSYNVAHVLNAWTRMPPIHRQLLNQDALTADFQVARGLLRVGRPYETAVKEFAPYDRIQDPNPATREALRTLMDVSRSRRQPAYLFINNRLEGNAPLTIKAIVDEDEPSHEGM